MSGVRSLMMRCDKGDEMNIGDLIDREKLDKSIVRKAVIEEEELKSIRMTCNKEKAANEVMLFHNYMMMIQTFHQSFDGYNYEVLENIEKPKEPTKMKHHELMMKQKIENYKPTLFEKVFKKDKEIIKQMADELHSEVKKDDRDYFDAFDNYSSDIKTFEVLKACLAGIKGQQSHAYYYWLGVTNPFKELESFGIKLNFSDSKEGFEVLVHHNNFNIIPFNEKLLRDNQVVAKKIPLSKRYELYKEFIMSCSIRIARESFGALPLHKAIVKTFIGSDPNAVLDVVYERDDFENIDFSNKPFSIISRFDINSCFET